MNKRKRVNGKIVLLNATRYGLTSRTVTIHFSRDETVRKEKEDESAEGRMDFKLAVWKDYRSVMADVLLCGNR